MENTVKTSKICNIFGEISIEKSLFPFSIQISKMKSG